MCSPTETNLHLSHHPLNTVYHLAFNFQKQKEKENVSKSRNTNPAAVKLISHLHANPQHVFRRSDVIYPHMMGPCVVQEMSQGHSVIPTFTSTFHPLHTRSAAAPLGCTSVFITSLFTANKQPVSQRQHGVNSLPSTATSTFDCVRVISERDPCSSERLACKTRSKRRDLLMLLLCGKLRRG